MTKNEDAIRKIILEFESGNVDSGSALFELKRLTHNPIDLYSLQNYWRSEDLETFIKRLAIMPINDWKIIDDEQAHQLIDEILDNLDRDDILSRNSDALEKRFAKSTGTISSMIFVDDLEVSSIILNELKKDTRIIL